jgi:uncharacterized protein YjbI with pentapeptide repeats
MRPSSQGGPTALTQLAENSVEGTWKMTEALSAFLRYSSPRSNESTPADPHWPKGPYKEPPCRPAAPPEEKYDFSTCNTFEPLARRNPAAQAALTALGSRSRDNERIESIPARFKAQWESANPPLEPNQPPLRDRVIRYINDYWYHQHRTDSNRQLVGEVEVGADSSIKFPEIANRPWLNLSHTSLVGAELAAPFLEGANLTRSDLSFSTLTHARLAKTLFTESWLVGVTLYGDDLRAANLEHADVRGSDLGQADLREAWMSGGDFSRANFWKANLSGAYLIASEMRELQTVSGAQLNDVVGYRADFSAASLRGDGGEAVCMLRAFLKEANFQNALMNGIDLRDSELQDAGFGDAVLHAVDLRGAKLDGATLSRTDLSGADLRGVDLSKTNGVPLTLERARTDSTTMLPHSWPPKLTSKAVVTTVQASRGLECTPSERTPEQRSAILNGASPDSPVR